MRKEQSAFVTEVKRNPYIYIYIYIYINAVRQLKRVRDRSELADAGAADRIEVERANKNHITIQLLLVVV